MSPIRTATFPTSTIDTPTDAARSPRIDKPMHTHETSVEGRGRRNRKRLTIVLALTASYLLVEVVAGIASHSLALIADAGHMLADAGALALALVAMKVAERSATPTGRCVV
jgi:Co/Zn/Cd efflux system component